MTGIVGILKGDVGWGCSANSEEELACAGGSCKCERQIKQAAVYEIERLRERCTYFYEALHDIALGAHGNDGIEFARKAIGFVKLEFDADMIAAANDLINRAALGEKE